MYPQLWLGLVQLFWGENYLVTVHAGALAALDQARTRWARLDSRQEHGVGYLAYLLFDSLVDGYFLVQEYVGERVEAIEEAVLKGADGGGPPRPPHFPIYMRPGHNPTRKGGQRSSEVDEKALELLQVTGPESLGQFRLQVFEDAGAGPHLVPASLRQADQNGAPVGRVRPPLDVAPLLQIVLWGRTIR